MKPGRLALAALVAAGLVGAQPTAQGGSQGGEIVFRRGGMVEPMAELFSLQLGGNPRKLNPGQRQGSDSLAAVSPDGRQVAVLIDRYSSLELYVVTIDGKRRWRIAARVAVGRVSWSPDGRRLAFETPSGAVHVADATGTGQRKLLSDAREPSWSPDGSRIAVEAGERVVVIRPDGRRLWSTRGSGATWSPDGSLIAVAPDPASERTVVLDAAGTTRASVAGTSAAWSPDGGRLALVRNENDTEAVSGTFLLELGSGRPARRVGPAGSRLEWSRNGHLAIGSEFEAGRVVRTVWVLAPGADTAQRRFDGELIGFSGDGRRLAVTRQVEVVVAGANGERPRTAVLAPVGYRYEVVPSWAGNATLVYQRRLFSADSDLYLARPDGTELRKLTGTLERDTDPDWSPDGSTLVFSRSESPFDEPDNEVALWKLPAGGGPSRLTTPDGNFDVDADWSPDGSRLVFAREIGNGSELFIVGADGTGTTRVGTSRTARTPSWSPDGMLIAFARGTPDGIEIAVIAPDGSGRRTLIPARDVGGERVGVGNPAWAPDGQSLAFDDGESVFVARADGTQIRRVTSGHGPVAWSPDSTRLLVTDEADGRSIEPPTNLWSVALDGTDRRRITQAVARDTDPDWRR